MAIKTIASVDQAALFERLATELLEFLDNSPRKHLTIALPGGRSVVGLLRTLSEQLRDLPLETLKKLQFFMLDERCVPLSSPDSNFKLLREGFFDSAIEEGLISEDQLHPFDITKGTVDQVLSDYADELKKFGGTFAAAVLGVGEDAHVGALFPNHPSIRNDTEMFFAFENSPKPPPYRMTASRSLIEKTDFGIALFIGEAKREAMEKFLVETSVEQCPVSIGRRFERMILGTDLV